MNSYEAPSISQRLSGNPYPGRGIVLGLTPDGTRAAAAYFIMGRSDNSRNRVFTLRNGEVFTEPFDPNKVEDPSLIIYAAVRQLGNRLIVTNGDQTDTVYAGLEAGKGFSEALESRCFEPDAPNYTPRISGMFVLDALRPRYEMSILKSIDAAGSDCARYCFSYPAKPGLGHFLHTYVTDGKPLPSFLGEPERICISGDPDAFAREIWESLDENNRISLYVRFTELSTGKREERLINNHQRGIRMNEFELKYGCNPNQKPARIYMEDGSDLPVEILNGRPGYINFLDAFNAWQLVRELKDALELPAAASFKHVSPTSAAVGLPLSEKLKRACFVDDIPGLDEVPLACAYARARGTDRMCSFGDWVALSDECDALTARLIQREVSDGVIAPGYTPEALEILKTKRKGSYNIVRIDPAYVPAERERKQVFGVCFEQGRNNFKIDRSLLQNIVTKEQELPETAARDLIVALITLKYTQSNSVCYAVDGQAIGVGAGQQSRIHCTRLAGSKADTWFLRQSEQVLNLPFRPDLSRPDRDNVIDGYINQNEEDVCAEGVWQRYFSSRPAPFTKEEQRACLDAVRNVALGSDAFFPFFDNIERAFRSGVRYIAQPGGSIRDDAVIDCCDRHGMVMCFTGMRLFHH